MDDLFQKAVGFLKATLNNCKNIDDKEKQYRREHSLRVAAIARHIAEQEKQDVIVSTVAAILHDVGKYETDVHHDHGRVSADVAMDFLKTSGLSDKQVKDIHYCIAKHVDDNAGYDYEKIPEAETVSDADNIDRAGVFRIFQFLQWDKADTKSTSELAASYEEQNLKREKLKNEYKRATDTANRLFQRNLQIQIDFFDNLVRELKLTDFPVEKGIYT